MRTIAIINQKGGCGKTTTAINLSGMLAHRGLRVLLVDLDPQSHCAAGLGVPETRIDLDIGDAMLAPPGRAIDCGRLLWRTGRNFDLAPSRMKLAGLEAARGGLADKADRDRRLAGVLQRLAPAYDVAVVDCSPSIGLLTFNALAAADAVLIPVETSFFSLQGATKQFNTIQSLSRRMNRVSEIWLLPTIHVPDSPMAQDLLAEVRRRFGDRVAPMVIRRDTTLAEAATFGQPIIEHAPEAPGAVDYLALCDWLLGQLERMGAVESAPMGQPAMMPPLQPGLTEVIRGEPEQAAFPDDLPAGPSEPMRPGGRSLADDIAALAMRMRKDTPRPDAAGPGVVAQPPIDPMLAEFHPPRQTVVMAPDARPGRPRPAPSVQRLMGVRVTTQGALFVQPLGLGRRVAICGEFNGWSPDADVMRANDELGVLELCLPLPPGLHRYQLIIDGRACPDPYNPDFEPSPTGGFHSLVRVAQPRETVPSVQPAARTFNQE